MGAGPGVIHQALWGAIGLPCRASTSPLTWGTGPPLPLLTGEPQASCPACRDWHAFPIHLTGKHHLHHLPVRLLGKKRAEKEGLGQWPSSPFMGARGNREAGSQPRAVARKGGFCSCTCWEESKEDSYSCSSFCPTHFALFLIYCHQVEYDSQALTPQVQRGQNAASSGCLAVLVP